MKKEEEDDEDWEGALKESDQKPVVDVKKLV